MLQKEESTTSRSCRWVPAMLRNRSRNREQLGVLVKCAPLQRAASARDLVQVSLPRRDAFGSLFASGMLCDPCANEVMQWVAVTVAGSLGLTVSALGAFLIGIVSNTELCVLSPCSSKCDVFHT